ncbi:ZmpA/ZmpB/ZmpC family metallo-endopeptidase, partial [Streptococcus fryi]
ITRQILVSGNVVSEEELPAEISLPARTRRIEYGTKEREPMTSIPHSYPTETPQPEAEIKELRRVEPIPFDEERIPNANRYVDEAPVVLEEGVAGERVIITRQILVSGNVVSEEELPAEISLPARTRRIEYGTKEREPMTSVPLTYPTEMPDPEAEIKEFRRVEPIPFDEERVPNANRYVDEAPVVLEEGVSGERVIITRQILVSGNVVSEEELPAEISKSASTRRVEYGTKEREQTSVPSTYPTSAPQPEAEIKELRRVEPIPFDEERVPNANRYVDEAPVVLEEGVAGERVIITRQILVSGNVVSEEELPSEISLPARTRRIEYGTKEREPMTSVPHTYPTSAPQPEAEIKELRRVEPIPFDEERVLNANRYVDEAPVVLEEGSAGERVIITRQILVSGDIVSEEELSSEISLPARNRRIAYGTKERINTFDFGAHGDVKLVRVDGKDVDLTSSDPATAYRLQTTNVYALNDALKIDSINLVDGKYRVTFTDYHYDVEVDRLGKPIVSTAPISMTPLYHNLYALAPYYSKQEIDKYAKKTDLSGLFRETKISRIHWMRDGSLLNNNYESANAVLLVFENGQTETLSLETHQSPQSAFSLFETENGLPVMVSRPSDGNGDLVERLSPVFNSLTYGKKNKSFKSTDYIDFYLEGAFESVKANHKEWLRVLLENTAKQANQEYLYQKIVSNKDRLMMAMAYLQRWYNFDLGKGNIAANSWQSLSLGQDALEFLLTLGKKSENLYASQTAETYKKVFAPLTKQANLHDFLDYNRKVFLPEETTNNWFKTTTKAYISEQAPKSIPHVLETFERLNNREFEKMYLPLLTLPERSVYLIPTHTTLSLGSISGYVSDLNNAQAMADFTKLVDRNARAHRDHIDFWYRISSDKVKDRLINNTVKVRDAHLINGRWYDESPAARDFFKPIGDFHNPNGFGADALSDGKDLTFYRLLLDKTGFESGSIWTHELVHALEDSIYLDGHGIRVTVGQENYAEGLFQSLRGTTRDAIVWNTYATLDESDSTFKHVNASPERFRNAQDLQTYTKRMLDVLYLLDYAEAKAILELPLYQKEHLLKKMTLVADNQDKQALIPSKIDQIVDFDYSDLKKITTWEDLVTANAVVNRFPFNDRVGLRQGPSAGRNAYHRIPLYTPMFGLSENSEGASGGYTFRRTAFELLAYKGFLEGMVPYISNQYSDEATHDKVPLSDTYIVKKVFQDDSFKTLTDFKLAMFKERIDKLERLKSVKNSKVAATNANDILDLFKKAYQEDMKNPSGNAVHRLRSNLYQAYFDRTDGFNSAIFEE